MHNIKKNIIGILGAIGLVAVTHASGIITIPSTLNALITPQNSLAQGVYFNRGGNNFQGAMIRKAPQISGPHTVVYGSDTITCQNRVRGFYYNNQRGARRRPLDPTSLGAMQGIDNSYNNMQLIGGFFTQCTGNGVDANAVYGQVTHTLTGTLSGEYKLAAGLIYDFSNNTYSNTGFTGSLLGGTNTTNNSGYIYDSAGGIGQLGTNQIISLTNTGNNQTGSNNNSNGGGGGGLTQDNCPNGDNSPSYYDGSCGLQTSTNNTTGVIISPPQGKACAYNDEQYISKGPFKDTINHRGLPYIEILRLSCVSRGVATKKGGRLYAPEQSITRAEVFKVVAKAMGVAFDDLTIIDEDKAYKGVTPFADVPANHWFAHYADYMYKYGMMDGLVDTDKDGNRYFHPDKPMQRYEAIKAIMLAYKKINPADINIAGQSVMGDVIDKNNPYYRYIREAEALGFISGIPQQNGSYNFAGQNKITRAEFAKIVGVPFMEQLLDVEDAARNSNLYKMIQSAVEKTQSDKLDFIDNIFTSLSTLDDKAFLKSFKVDKKVFLEVLYKSIVEPLVAEQE